MSERPAGTFTRQLFLGETLDADHIEADYHAGVLTLIIPVMEAAKPRKLAITTHKDTKQLSGSAATSTRRPVLSQRGGRAAGRSSRPGRGLGTPYKASMEPRSRVVLQGRYGRGERVARGASL